MAYLMNVMAHMLLGVTPAVQQTVMDDRALRVFTAVVLVIAFTFIATSKKVRRFHRVPIIARLVGGGWFAIFLGFALGPHVLDFVNDRMILELRSLLVIGLGWIGLIIGLQARRSLLQLIPMTVWRTVALDSLVSILSAVVIGGLVFTRWFSADGPAWLITPVALLASCMIGWSAETRSLIREHDETTRQFMLFIRYAAGLFAIVAVTVFGVLSSIPQRAAPAGLMEIDLPGTAFKLTAAIVVAGGAAWIARVLMRLSGRGASERMVITLGLVAFVAGFAIEFNFAPIFSGMLVGIVIATWKGQRSALSSGSSLMPSRPSPCSLPCWPGSSWSRPSHSGV